MLLKKIDAMKRLGYQEHIIAILGWCLHRGRLCAVFELAATGNLLSEVRRRKENDQEKINLKEIFSILWQIATGKFLKKEEIFNVTHSYRKL
jgi:serine/threonine protein kinase